MYLEKAMEGWETNLLTEFLTNSILALYHPDFA